MLPFIYYGFFFFEEWALSGASRNHKSNRVMARIVAAGATIFIGYVYFRFFVLD